MAPTSGTAPDRSELIIRTSFARFDIRGLATATGIVMGTIIFLATLLLWIQGAAHDDAAAVHLLVLSHFYPGFSVSIVGALVGFGYGFITGFVVGTAIGFSWNLTHYMFVMRATGRYGTGGDL